MSSYATQRTPDAGASDGEPATEAGPEAAREAEAEAARQAEAEAAREADTTETAPAFEAQPSEAEPSQAEPSEGEPSEAERAAHEHRDDEHPGDAAFDEEIPDEEIPYEENPHEENPHDDGIRYEPPKVSKLAVVSLVTAIVPLLPIALVTGVAALVGIRRSGRRGHGMAVSALFIAAAWIIVAGGVGTVAHLTHGFKKPVKVTYKEASVFKLKEGDCLNTPNGQQVSLVSCSISHDYEVFGTFTLPAGAWPGTQAIQQAASAGCSTRLTAYINPQLAISLAQTYVYPTQVDWTAGTRTVICEVRAASGQLTQSVRGGT
jgi:hypothetical protein